MAHCNSVALCVWVKEGLTPNCDQGASFNVPHTRPTSQRHGVTASRQKRTLLSGPVIDRFDMVALGFRSGRPCHKQTHTDDCEGDDGSPQAQPHEERVGLKGRVARRACAQGIADDGQHGPQYGCAGATDEPDRADESVHPRMVSRVAVGRGLHALRRDRPSRHDSALVTRHLMPIGVD